MADVLTHAQRRFNMSRIRGRDTRPEMLIRRGLHAKGLRYRLHVRALPGTPDLVFPRHGVVLFVHGCFWHAHGCPMTKLPATRPEFWAEKLRRNVERDDRAVAALVACGWRVLIIWECALRGPAKHAMDVVLSRLERAVLHGGRKLQQLQGKWSTQA